MDCYNQKAHVIFCLVQLRVLKPMWLKMQHISMRMFSIIIVLPLDIKWVRKLNILLEIYQHFSEMKQKLFSKTTDYMHVMMWL